RGEEAPRGINGKATRLSFGRHAPDCRQFSSRSIDAEAGQRAGGSLARIEKPAIGREVDVGGPGFAVEARRQCRDMLQVVELSLVRVISERGQGGVQLVN